MEKIREIIQKKPSFFLVLSFVYLILVGLLKWFIHPPIGAVWYLVGGFVGIYFLDVAEVFFHLVPSPFRSILFTATFVIVAFFVVTSSGSLIASGMVLTIFLTLILWQVGEWRMRGNLDMWYQMISGPVSSRIQRRLLILTVVLFCIVTVYFIRA